MTFQLDTAGYVEPPYSGPTCAPAVYWEDLSPFAQGYVAAMFASAVVELRRDAEDRVQMNLDDLGFRHLAPETLARIIADCEAWRAEYTGRVAEMSAHRSDMGRAFWRIRQEGKRSTFPPLTIHLDGDGKVRFA